MSGRARNRTATKRLMIICQDLDPHVDVMVSHLEDRGIRPFRLHTQDLQGNLNLQIRPESSRGDWRWRLEGPVEAITDREVGSVWNRRTLFRRDPALSNEEAEFAEMESRETMMGVYRMTDAFWVNHPDRVRRAESKPDHMSVAVDLGFTVPRTLFTNDGGAARKFFDACDGQVVFKVLIQGRLGAEDSLGIYTSPVTRKQLDDDVAIRRAPCFFQEHLPKAADLRVTVIGERIFAVEIRSQEDPDGTVDWRRGSITQMPHVSHQLPAAIEAKCHELLRHYGLHYGAIDLVLTPDGEYFFLEINPSGQFSWVEGLTRLPLFDTLADLLTAPLFEQP